MHVPEQDVLLRTRGFVRGRGLDLRSRPATVRFLFR